MSPPSMTPTAAARMAVVESIDVNANTLAAKMPYPTITPMIASVMSDMISFGCCLSGVTGG